MGKEEMMDTKMTPDELRKALDGKRTDGMRLSAHLRETVAAPWLDPDDKPVIFKDAEDCDLSWRSLLEHEAIEVEALEDAGYAAADDWEKLQDQYNGLVDIADGFYHRTVELVAENEKLEKRLEAAEKLRKYARHEATCDFMYYYGKAPCTCGLAALAGGKP